VTEPTNHPVVTLKENRFPLFSLILVILAFALTAYMAYLNYEVTKVAGAQLIRAQQLQERTQTKFMDQYARFLYEQAQSARFERTFEVRQKHYADFMGALSDAWNSAGRKNAQDLDAALHQLAKSYYALEPFLDQGSRLYLQKRITIFHNLAKQLIGYEQNKRGIIMEDKSTMDRMIEEFQDFLYPLLFEPIHKEGKNGESGEIDR
tara:strand:- start:10695 stop:11312 length:618 start_codon:yes stop_codon:yes gene_type:complete